jgi:hypothetical protein
VKSPEYYRGREQTYLKHFFLERYLERVAYNIGWSAPEFVYVDGFSGPWRSEAQGGNRPWQWQVVTRMRSSSSIEHGCEALAISSTSPGRASASRPWIWDADVKSIVMERRRTVKILDLKDRERTPKPGHFLVKRAE